MHRGISWVEWLAIALLAGAGFLFLFRDDLGSFAPTAQIRGWGGISPSAAWAITALFGSMLLAAVGFSLFLVRPLLLLGPRVPMWPIPVCGAFVFWFDDPVCRALYPGDVHSEGLYNCRNNLPLLGIAILVFGTVLLVRRFQVFRKCELNSESNE
jgi:hypothetical protein